MDNTKVRQNNFNILRFIAAIMVMAGHMSYLSGNAVPIFLGVPVHVLGVRIFFLIGGYLVAKSWMSDPDLKRYAKKRFMRIWPPLFVFVLIAMFFVGPFLSTLSTGDYFKYLFQNGGGIFKKLVIVYYI